jgi:general secretion pathway protein F
MPEFRFTAISAAGETTRGSMEATDEAALVARLQRQGQMPLRVEPASRAGFFAGLLTMEFGRGKALRPQEVANITRELAIMLGAGQDLDRALRFLIETAPGPRVAGLIGQVRNAVRDGAPLAAALAQHPASFSKLYVGLVRAGEAGGTLAATLEHLAVLMERQRALASAVTSAMIYPALLMLAAIGSVVLLLTEVLPQFVPLFAQNGAALPASTQLLIEAGAFVGSYGIWMLLAVLMTGLVVRQMLARPGPRLLADRALLRLPVIGGLTREVMAARFTRTLGTLLINGVPLIGALGIARDTIGNLACVAAVDAAALAAKGGAGLSAALAVAGVFPARTVYLLRLGEETAELGRMSLRAAEIHEENSRVGVQRLVALLVPAITILMGALVAGIVSSLLLAMLSLNDLAN